MRIPERQRMILEWIEAGVINIAVAGLAIMTSPYGCSLRTLEKRHEEILNGKIFIRKEQIQIKQRSFNTLFKKLQNEGLIEITKERVVLTKNGRSTLKTIKEKFLPKKDYQIKKDNSLKLVIFDIPEKERAKRDWLRESLKNMDFKMIQKSVWLGKVKIPAEFLEDLKWLKLIDYVDILAVTRTGSLRQIK
jgi:DNA-binding transcriptional regulator PaaX